MTLPKSVELQWQKEMICSWLDTPSLSDDVRSELIEMLTDMQSQMEKLATDPSHNEWPEVPAKNT